MGSSVLPRLSGSQLAPDKAQDFFESSRLVYGAQGCQCSLGLLGSHKEIKLGGGPYIHGIPRTNLDFSKAAEDGLHRFALCSGKT